MYRGRGIIQASISLYVLSPIHVMCQAPHCMQKETKEKWRCHIPKHEKIWCELNVIHKEIEVGDVWQMDVVQW